jgi:hypothetical protein
VVGTSGDDPRSLVGPAGCILGDMADVTRILTAIEAGDPRAAEQLLPLVYDELRRLAADKLAREAPGQTTASASMDSESTSTK